MKIVTVKHNGDLKVCWKDCYQRNDFQYVASAKQCDKIIIMGEIEFKRLHDKGII